ncbi:hypothetical protein L1049_022110 [Liquidambar formosana]|uniref:Gamma-glutamylcyclotransferase family protein n=1 Tax=Liquidambar formosana TaxID=63359 RepID=A0AAP0WPT7_LIQFO
MAMPATDSVESPTTNGNNRSLIFTYGTLKRDFPNHYLLQDLIGKNDAVYLGTFITIDEFPLVIGPHGIPYLLNLPGSGHRVSGELYAVSARGLVRVDELEGTSVGHYERLPILVRAESVGEGCGDGAVVNAEAYYAHRSYAEEMWRKKGEKGLNAYAAEVAKEYVKRENRPKDRSFVDDIRLFLSSSSSS